MRDPGACFLRTLLKLAVSGALQLKCRAQLDSGAMMSWFPASWLLPSRPRDSKDPP